MQLYATPLSHFSRKVRILMDLYDVPYEFVDVGNVARADQAAFAGNPNLRVPVLVDDGKWLIESDHIAKYLVEKFDSGDRYRVVSANFADLNFRAVLNGIMMEEVKLIIARRTGLPTEEYPFFDKCKLAIRNGLEWLETNSGAFSTASPGYLEFHLTCLWQHLAFYDLLPQQHPKLMAIVEEVTKNPKIARTSPFILGARKAPSHK